MVRAANSDSTARAVLAGRGSLAYRKAFEGYLRYGTPIDLAVKAEATEEHPTSYYIWRTQRDGRVRPSHRENEGKIFAWDDPPPTGHPGEDYGCRCWAEPYVPAAEEHFNITMQGVSDEGPPWGSADFVYHYFFGGGRTVTLRETGNLRAVVAEFRKLAVDVPTKLPGKIADKARENPDGSFQDDFEKSYPMQKIVFSLGDTIIKGPFKGAANQMHGMLELQGEITFEQSDKFRDPIDVEEKLKPFLERIDMLIRQAGADNIVGAVAIQSYVEALLAGLPLALSPIPFPLSWYIGTRIREILRDPDRIPTEPVGTPYDIVDQWRGTFSGRVLMDRDKSQFKYVEG